VWGANHPWAYAVLHAVVVAAIALAFLLPTLGMSRSLVSWVAMFFVLRVVAGGVIGHRRSNSAGRG